MAAPEFVPLKPNDRPRNYASPPGRDDEWHAVRPGEVVSDGGQPDLDAGRMGAPGPDQGYLLGLVPLLRDELRLNDGERAWTTIGVSENIIEASWQALHDSIVYGLLHAG